MPQLLSSVGKALGHIFRGGHGVDSEPATSSLSGSAAAHSTGFSHRSAPAPNGRQAHVTGGHPGDGTAPVNSSGTGFAPASASAKGPSGAADTSPSRPQQPPARPTALTSTPSGSDPAAGTISDGASGAASGGGGAAGPTAASPHAGPLLRTSRASLSDTSTSAAGEALRQASMTNRKANFTRDNLVAYMRWVRASRGALKLAGKGSFRSPHPQLLLRCEHWLEVTDEQHRYGSNLRVYFDYWVAEMEAAELTPPPSPALMSPSPSHSQLIALATAQSAACGQGGVGAGVGAGTGAVGAGGTWQAQVQAIAQAKQELAQQRQPGQEQQQAQQPEAAALRSPEYASSPPIASVASSAPAPSAIERAAPAAAGGGGSGATADAPRASFNGMGAHGPSRFSADHVGGPGPHRRSQTGTLAFGGAPAPGQGHLLNGGLTFDTPPCREVQPGHQPPRLSHDAAMSHARSAGSQAAHVSILSAQHHSSATSPIHLADLGSGPTTFCNVSENGGGSEEPSGSSPPRRHSVGYGELAEATAALCHLNAQPRAASSTTLAVPLPALSSGSVTVPGGPGAAGGVAAVVSPPRRTSNHLCSPSKRFMLAAMIDMVPSQPDLAAGALGQQRGEGDGNGPLGDRGAVDEASGVRTGEDPLGRPRAGSGGEPIDAAAARPPATPQPTLADPGQGASVWMASSSAAGGVGGAARSGDATTPPQAAAAGPGRDGGAPVAATPVATVAGVGMTTMGAANSAIRAAKLLSQRSSVGNGSNFFRWLDCGPGLDVDLAPRGVSRAKLDTERVKYLTPAELLEYELDVDMETGLLRYKRSGRLLHTGPEGRGSLDLEARRPPTPPPPAVPLALLGDSTAAWYLNASGGMLGALGGQAQAQGGGGGAGVAAAETTAEPSGVGMGAGALRSGGNSAGGSARSLRAGHSARRVMEVVREGALENHPHPHAAQPTNAAQLLLRQQLLHAGADGAGPGSGSGSGGGAAPAAPGSGVAGAEAAAKAGAERSDPDCGISEGNVSGGAGSSSSNGDSGAASGSSGSGNSHDGQPSSDLQPSSAAPAPIAVPSPRPAAPAPALVTSPFQLPSLAAPFPDASASTSDATTTPVGAGSGCAASPSARNPGGHPHLHHPCAVHATASGGPIAAAAGGPAHAHSHPQCDRDREDKVAKWIYVVDPELRLYVHPKVRGRFHHSSFLRGGAVVAAGGLSARHGQLRVLTADSGHYWPREENFRWLCEHLVSVGADLSACELRSKHMPVPAATGRELMERMGVPPPPWRLSFIPPSSPSPALMPLDLQLQLEGGEGGDAGEAGGGAGGGAEGGFDRADSLLSPDGLRMNVGLSAAELVDGVSGLGAGDVSTGPTGIEQERLVYHLSRLQKALEEEEERRQAPSRRETETDERLSPSEGAFSLTPP